MLKESEILRDILGQGTGGSHFDIVRLSVMKRGSTPTCPHAPFKTRENIFEKRKSEIQVYVLRSLSRHVTQTSRVDALPEQTTAHHCRWAGLVVVD